MRSRRKRGNSSQNLLVWIQNAGNIRFDRGWLVNTAKKLSFIGIAWSCVLTLNPVAAQNWTQTSAPSNRWYSVASSADGRKLVAVANTGPPNFGGQIYTSTNSGATWRATSAPDTNWYCVATSADGEKLVAAFLIPTGGRIYISTNAGNTWTLTTAPRTNWLCVASSADGNKLFAAGGGPIFVSTNGGGIWLESSVASNVWTSVSCSADGNKLTAVGDGSEIYTSTNSGVSWSSGPYGGWLCSASSVDGTRAAVGGYDLLGSAIYVTTNSGATWMPTGVPLVPAWGSLAFSADGSKLVAVAYPGPIYTSTDLGATWQSNNAPSMLWHSVASSADGSKLVTVAWNGPIYTSQSTPVPLLKLTPLVANLGLSWIVPSTNFVAQQNSDLSTTNWTDVTNSPTLNLKNLQNEVALPLPTSNTFYRLKSP